MYQTCILESAEGVQQGDPLGPLLFCLALKQLTLKMDTEVNLWYMDDGILGGKSQSVLNNFFTLKSAATAIGLTINERKCEVYNKGNADWPSNIPSIDAEQFSLLGGGVTLENTERLLEVKEQKLRTLYTEVQKLPTHHGFTILKHSLGCQNLISLFRSSPVRNQEPSNQLTICSELRWKKF
jgi:hypothetical protein